ncbi:MAG: hypothetical protein DRQ02_00665, partial [Candidatus Latescibacterota bacterium]
TVRGLLTTAQPDGSLLDNMPVGSGLESLVGNTPTRPVKEGLDGASAHLSFVVHLTALGLNIRSEPLD